MFDLRGPFGTRLHQRWSTCGRFRFALTLAVTSVFNGPAHAQLPPIETWPIAGAQRQQFRTVEVNADRSVTLKIDAPAANSVEARFNGKGYLMEKDAKGVWTVQVPAVDPQIYTYSFRIDGANVNEGEIEVIGARPADYSVQDVPHGTVTIVPYFSHVLNRHRSFRVYLPPQWYSQPSRKFPVFYLFNSQGDEGWTVSGRANLVLDNLIAQKRAVPMILVMPDNRISPDGLESSAPTVRAMEQELPREIFPLVEGRFRGMSGRLNRAIAGLSFGGGTAFGVGMRHLDWFGWVGEFGTGTFGGLANPTTGPNAGYVSYMVPYDGEKIAPGMHAKLLASATKPKLFFMSVGQSDPRRMFQEAAYQDFLKRGIKPVFVMLNGGHDWEFFRNGMIDMTARLFKP